MKKYGSYRDSGVDWIRDIPKEWRIIRGKYVFQHIKEINNENQEINLLSLTLKGVLNKDINSNEGLRPTEYSTYQIFEKDDLVFKLIDLENTQTSRVGLVHERGIMSPVYIRLEPKDTINPKYSFYYYYDLYKQHIYNFLGSGVRSSLTPSNLLEIELTLPPLSEQQQIVSFLDSKTSQIDELIQKKERKIELLKEYRTSLINEVVTKGLNPNVEMKDSGVEWIGSFPSGWMISKIKFHTSIISKGTTPTTIGKEINTDGIIRFIKGENITDKGLEFHSEYYIDEETNDLLERSQLKENDILFVIAGTVGKCCIIKKEHLPSNTSQAISFIRLKNSENHNFILYLLKSDSVKIQFDILVVKSAQPNLSMEDLSNLYVTYPPLSEQQQIVSYLDEQTHKIDSSIQSEEKKIELLKEYRLSLISEVVTGKIDVRLN